MTGVPRLDPSKLAFVAGPAPRRCQFIAAKGDAIAQHVRRKRTTDGLICGDPSIEGKPYCAEHAALCYAGFLVKSPQIKLDESVSL